jgi:hypothetical protein
LLSRALADPDGPPSSNCYHDVLEGKEQAIPNRGLSPERRNQIKADVAQNSTLIANKNTDLAMDQSNMTTVGGFGL